MTNAQNIGCLLVATVLTTAGAPAEAQFPGGAQPTAANGQAQAAGNTTPPLPSAYGAYGTAPSYSADPLSAVPPLATQPAAMPGAAVQPASVLPAPQPPLPLPPDPAHSSVPLVFGQQMFAGRFANQAFTGFNPDYQIAVGDRVSLRMWGGFTYEAVLVVDAQGNVFIPNVGPTRIVGTRNSDLNAQVERQVKQTFRNSVGVYATLEAAQPVKVFVTGFVRAPGLYSGLSSDSVLAYLDRAGGIDPARGSFLEVSVLRRGKLRAKVNLYRFLLDGQMDMLQMQEGDTIVVAPRAHSVQVSGAALNPYIFEFAKADISAAELLAMARPRPEATHISIVRKIGAELRSEYHPIADASKVVVHDGDEVTITSDKYPGTILVRIEGANLGERSLVMPYGARLKDVVARLRPAPQANVAALQMFRRSVAARQKDLLETSLRSLETYALTGRSATAEEATLRQKEGSQILQFIERARQVQPRGQVVIGDATKAGDTLLEDGDVIRVPETNNVVLVSGEVMMPNALIFDPKADMSDYVRRAGGFTQSADSTKILVIRQDGSVAEAGGSSIWSAAAKLEPGDEILVLPKVQTKSLEVARGITQILYQIAVAAKVVFDL
ncbi:SLBB domain-containing protein [Rubrivivax sp. JA1024]|nr:SLBB domain-containing protein [Rubrivivax sp. JA1024]